jgi:hypothetical protein
MPPSLSRPRSLAAYCPLLEGALVRQRRPGWGQATSKGAGVLCSVAAVGGSVPAPYCQNAAGDNDWRDIYLGMLRGMAAWRGDGRGQEPGGARVGKIYNGRKRCWTPIPPASTSPPREPANEFSLPLKDVQLGLNG